MYGTYSWAQSQQHMKQALSSGTSSTEGQCHGCAFDRLAGVYDNIVDWEETSMLYGLMRSRLLSKARVSRVTSSCFWASACLSMLRGVVLVQLSPVTTIHHLHAKPFKMHHMHQCSDCKIHALLSQNLVTRPTDKRVTSQSCHQAQAETTLTSPTPRTAHTPTITPTRIHTDSHSPFPLSSILCVFSAGRRSRVISRHRQEPSSLSLQQTDLTHSHRHQPKHATASPAKVLR